MIEKGFIRIGDKTVRMNKHVCEEDLGGRWMDALGCVVSSKFKYKVKNNQIYIAPEGSKRFPVLVPKVDFANLTGRGGRLADMHTYVVG